jgi:hypothetical protein
MKKAFVNRSDVFALIGALWFGATTRAQSARTEQSLSITVQVLDARNGKPLKNQHVLVFAGPSSDAVKTHAQHTGLVTDEAGIATLTVNPSETRWLQVFADGSAPCSPNPNQSSFSVSEIMSKGLVTPSCSSLIRAAPPGHLIVFARPTGFMEKNEAVGMAVLPLYKRQSSWDYFRCFLGSTRFR